MEPKNWELPVKKIPSRQKLANLTVWNTAFVSYEHQLFGAVSSVCYSPTGEYVGCVSSNQQLLLRVPPVDGCLWNDQKNRLCHAIAFRDDGKLVLLGIDSRVVVKSTDSDFHRSLSGHTRHVRDALFFSRHNFASCSDDATIKLWDLSTATELATAKHHTDYVRTLAANTEATFFSGSYDRTVALWDVRLGVTTPVSHASLGEEPIEKLCFVRDSNLLAAAVKDVVVLMDVRKLAGDPIHSFSSHAKSVSSIAYSSTHNVLITGSLDARMKFFSLTSFEEIATRKCSHPVTAVSVHPEGTEIGIGMGSGKFEILSLEKVQVAESDVKMSTAERAELALRSHATRVGNCLRSFHYQRALKTALYSRIPDVILSTIEELLRRSTLRVALNGQNDRTIVQLLRFCVEHLDSPQYVETLTVALDVLYEMYGNESAKSPLFHRELLRGHKQIGQSLNALRSLQPSIGILEMIMESGSENIPC